MMRQLYSLLMWLAQPLVRLKLHRRAQTEPLYGHYLEERFGGYHSAPQTDRTLVWIHAVSLGETRAAALLMAQLRKDQPGTRFLLTHGTATGRSEGQKLLQSGDWQVWQPWDSAAVVQRFLGHFKPRIGILMETELWPNLIALARGQGVPMVLANARLSEKSFLKTRRFAWLARPTYQALSAVWAQTAADAQRLEQVGAKLCGVFGNLKFDAMPDAAQLAAGRALRQQIGRPVLLFASSRDGEELQFLKCIRKSSDIPSLIHKQFDIKNIVIKNIKNHNNNIKEKINATNLAQILIVPRHPQRFDAVAQLVQAGGWALRRRSQSVHGFEGATPADAGPAEPAPTAGEGAATHAATVWLGDSLGEMAFYYGLADVALLGGSFEPLGGQNLIEAAACACPVVMGPHTFNFADAAELALQAGAARRATSLENAVGLAAQWLADPTARQQAAALAQGFAQEHQGATAKLAHAIWELLPSPG